MSSDAIPQGKRPSVLGGAMIIAGTAVGAGMFSIPIMTAGVWFTGSVLLLIYTWFCMYTSGLMILEANLNYPIGSSFHTITKDLLGSGWTTINGLSVAFVLYILTYAYISAGGSMIQENLASQKIILSPALCGVLFAVVVAVVVWISTKAVDRLCTILIGGMVIAFAMSAGGMITEVKPAILFNTAAPEAQYLPYALVALPFLLTSFGFHGNVPGLVKYYQKDAKSVVRSLFIGSLISLVIYILWQLAAQGNVPRDNFKQVMADGGNITALLGQMKAVIHSETTTKLLDMFSYMALASSFLGVSLGLFDYIADFFKFKDNGTGRLKSALFTFLPPAVLAVLYPDGFLYAIGYAGLAATIWAAIIPAMMARATRRRFPAAGYRVPGGNLMIIFIILFGVINAVTHILSMMGLLPVYR